MSVRKKRLILLAGVALGALGGLVAYTQQSKPLDPFEEAMRQREMYLETFGILPGDLFVEEGKELFYRKGPSGKTHRGVRLRPGQGGSGRGLRRLAQVLPRHGAGGGPGE